ncbi:hypothetical protein JCM6882_002033 [Rhodosporidiobolus microsporus]
MPCGWLPSLPANARSSIVLIKRPCTFLFSLVLALAALAVSAFFNLTHLSPPTCPRSACSDDEPRTRPRPAPPSVAKPPTPKEAEPPKTALQQLFTAFRAPAATRPPLTVRRASARSLGGTFAFHELDELTEAREEEEQADEEEAGRRKSNDLLTRSSSPEGVAPALTPDGGSDADTDGGSEVDTLEDEQGHFGQPAVSKEGKPKGLTILTGMFRRTPSTSKKSSAATSPVVASPDDASGPSSPASSTHSASSSTLSTACKKACPVKTLRQRASTTAGASRPNLPSSLSSSFPRRQFSEPGLSSPTGDYFAQSPSSVSTWSISTSASSLLGDASTSTSATSLSVESASSSSQGGRKRSVSSLFSRTPFRSLSPLARSPLTSPEPSPPPSPTLAPERTPALFSKSRRSRGRSPGPSPASTPPLEAPRAPPMRSRISSGPGADCSGASGLALSDVLR